MNVDVVTLEGLHEGLGHPVGLRAAYRREARHKAQADGKVDGLMGPIAAAIVREPLDRLRNALSAEAPLHALEHQVADHLPADAASGGAPGHDLPITGIQGEGDADHLAVPARDRKSVV